MKSFFFILLCSSLSLSALEVPMVKINNLAKDNTWLNLLHYNKNTEKSSILNKDFFLSPLGKKNPMSELQATIYAYSQPIKDESHAVCRFPARYKWLSKHIELQNYQTIQHQCKLLYKWNILQDVDSLSIVFVSGFLDNPASAFGHSFLKINKVNASNNDLFDTTISYGAKLPEKYTMLSYMYNGVTGGYNATYSDKYYYMDDIVYSNQEFREMWEYKLALNKDEVNLLLLHLWELRGIEFQYYFFNRNCGYKVSELLELVYNEDLRGKAYVWYAPIETFFRLRDMGKRQNRSIFKNIQYIPSKQQNIYAQYHGFSDIDKGIINRSIKLESVVEVEQILNQSNQIKILDFILAYYTYKNTNKSKEEQLSNVFQKKVLLKRLSLPIYQYSMNVPEDKQDITQSDKSSYVSLSYKKKNISFSYAPFVIESVGYNQYGGDILKIFNTTIGLKNDDIYLEQLDIVKIRRLKSEQIPFDVENPYSWSLHLGMENKSNMDYFLDLGIGYSWNFTQYIKYYAMLHTSVHSQNQHYRVNPNMGMHIAFDKFRMNIDYGVENIKYKSIFNEKFSIETQYKVDSAFSVFLMMEKKETKTIEFGLKWYL